MAKTSILPASSELLMMGYPLKALNSGLQLKPLSLIICSIRPCVVAPWLTPMTLPSKSSIEVKPERFLTMSPT